MSAGDEPDAPPEGPPVAPDVPEDRTVFMPAGSMLPVTPDATPAPEPAPEPEPTPAPVPTPDPAPPAPPQTSFGVMAPRLDGNRIQIGDVLNHIFEVKRFIARGGMGEVFEGENVNSDERVAIKVMLPALAADPNVVAMFRKEARTLTRLSHPALVQYRVLAQEPQLGVLYIVTEYIDGRNLSDVLDSVPRGAAELIALTRRLADGLRVAHGLGAVHRDISPDNVLLEDGRLDQAKIIDFGIAKDLDPTTATIVGDGFAGKLNYVAPEQLGDFNREVGPWSDVYSLALVILAVALGRNVDMGATLVDAVDKRRAGPDLSAAPSGIRPVLEAMLKPNPVDRLRSMDEVIAALDVVPFAVSQQEATTPATVFEPAAPRAPVADVAEPAVAKPPRAPLPKPVLFGGIGVAALAVIGGLVFMMSSGKKPAAPPPAAPAAAPAVIAQNPVEASRTALAAALPGIPCTWLDLRDVKAEGNGVSLTFAGVAGSTASAQGAIREALVKAGVADPSIDLEGVAPIDSAACSALDAYRGFKSTSASLLTTPQPTYEMDVQANGDMAGHAAARTQIQLSSGAFGNDMTLIGMESNGSLTQLFANKAAFLDYVKKQTGALKSIESDVDTVGWSGYVLITGKGPFDASVVAPGIGARAPAWAAKLASMAAANGWKAEMVWFKVVNDKLDAQPTAPASPSATTPPAGNAAAAH